MATRKTTKPKTIRYKSTARRSRRTTVHSKRGGNLDKFFAFLVPFILLIAIVVCFGFLFSVGFRHVAASPFFDVKRIEILGNSRVEDGDIERIVRNHTDKIGVFDVELDQVKNEIEQLHLVKGAVVSRILPDGIRVLVIEKGIRGVARLKDGDFWIDDDAEKVAQLGKNDSRAPFVLKGWDESDTEKALKDNKERIKQFSKIRDDFAAKDLTKEVSAIDMTDLQDIHAITTDSHEEVTVSLGKEDFGDRMKLALKMIDGKGKSIESLTSQGGNVVVRYRQN